MTNQQYISIAKLLEQFNPELFEQYKSQVSMEIDVELLFTHSKKHIFVELSGMAFMADRINYYHFSVEKRWWYRDSMALHICYQFCGEERYAETTGSKIDKIISDIEIVNKIMKDQ
ncbi:MAG: hypothetical protein WCG93_16645 [Paludibacter sp.]